MPCSASTPSPTRRSSYWRPVGVVITPRSGADVEAAGSGVPVLAEADVVELVVVEVVLLVEAQPARAITIESATVGTTERMVFLGIRWGAGRKKARETAKLPQERRARQGRERCEDARRPRRKPRRTAGTASVSSAVPLPAPEESNPWPTPIRWSPT